MEDDSLQKYIKTLKAARSDNDKFAALILITKIMKGKDDELSARKEIIDALGYTFLTRLLKTATVPDDCPPSIYKSVALSILSSCCSDPDVASHPELKKQISVFNEIITNEINTSSAECEWSVIEDCYDCLNALASTETGQHTLIVGGVVPALVTVITGQANGHTKAYHILMQLLKGNGVYTWTENIWCYHKMMNSLVAEFKENQEDRKFELCEILTFFLTNYIADKDHEMSWIQPLTSTLNQVLRCRLGTVQRERVLKLASAVVTTCGVETILPPVAPDGKLFLLLTHLNCIEVKMLLEDTSMQQIEDKVDMLCAHYALLEAVIGHMTTGQSPELDKTGVIQLHSALTAALSSVLYFLSQVAASQPQQKQYHPVVIASVRMLGAWLAEETSALKKEIVDLLPFLVHICHVSFETVEANRSVVESATGRPDCCGETVPGLELAAVGSTPRCRRGEEFCGVDAIRFLLPGLCHLTSEDSARQILLQEELHTLLVEYFKQKMKHFMENRQDTQIQDTVCTLCGIFLNLTVTEPDLSGSHHAFFVLLDTLFLFLPQIVHDSSLLVVTANLTTLGLMILRKQIKRTDLDTANRDGFLAACVSFVKKAYTASQNNTCPSLVLSHDYVSVWSSVKLLWFLSMDNLSAIMSSLPEVVPVVMKSGWLPSLVKTLAGVQSASMDRDVASTFLQLLLAVASRSPAARQVIGESGGLEVARVHNSPELCRVLSTS